MTFPIHDAETAPGAAGATLSAAQKGYGFIPNLLGVMANAPALLAAYATLSTLFGETSLSPVERLTVLLTTSFENDCAYCMAAHSANGSMHKAPDDVIAALRAGTPIADPKLEALRRFTRAVVANRGWLSKRDVQDFRDAGYGEQQVLEVVLGVGLKTLSNYTNHIAQTPLDAAFEAVAWTRPR